MTQPVSASAPKGPASMGWALGAVGSADGERHLFALRAFVLQPFDVGRAMMDGCSVGETKGGKYLVQRMVRSRKPMPGYQRMKLSDEDEWLWVGLELFWVPI